MNNRRLSMLLVLVFGGLIACNCAGIPQQLANKSGDPKQAGADIKPRFILESGLLDTWGKEKNGPHYLTISRDGKYLLALASTNTENIQVWDLTTLKKLHGIRAPNGTMHAHSAIAWDSRTAAYMQFFPKASITIFDMITGDKKCTIDDDDRHLISQSPHRCMQFSPDGKRLALACKSAIVFWDTSTGKVVTTWPGRAYSLSPYFANGTRIASSGGASVSIWDVEKGKVIKTFIGGTSAFAITPDELTVFSQNGIVRIWDLADGNLRKEVKEYSGTYQSVVTPNNRTGIWPTNVGLVVFDLETGTKKQDLTLNEPYLMGLAMTTDGKTLITSDSKGLIKGWNVNANGMVE